MKNRIPNKYFLLLILIFAVLAFASCARTSETNIDIGGTKYNTVKVYCDPENAEYAERLVHAFLSATSLSAELSEDRATANIVLTTDTSEFDMGEKEWAVNVDNGVAYLASATSYGISLAADGLEKAIYDSDGTLSLKAGKPLSGLLLSKEDYLSQSRLVIYPEFPARINKNFDYSVSVTQGSRTEKLPVYNHTMEYHVDSRSIGGDLYRRFSTFAFSGEQVRVDIKVNCDFESYSVLPSAKQFESSFANGVISVYLDKPEYFMIRLDQDDNSIMTVFADYPEFPLDIPDKNADNVYFIEGWEQYGENGLWDITEPDTIVYVAPGAVLNNRVLFKSSAKGSKILGRGAIVDPYENIYEYDIRVAGTEGAGYKLLTTSNQYAEIDGLHLLDARCFNIWIGGKYSDARNLKILATMMNTDGISCSGAQSVIENVYMHVGDNGLVISGCPDTVYRDIIIGTTCGAIFPQSDNYNILLENTYIFRTNDGVVNHEYNGAGPTYNHRQLDITFRNFDCVDCLNLPHLIRSRRMGTSQKYMYFENVNMPSMSGVTDPHKGQGAENTYRLANMTKTPEILETGNNYIHFLNLYIDGKPITDMSQVIINDTQEGNEFYFVNDGTYTPVAMDSHKVNYTAPGKVFIGRQQISFNNEPKISGGTFTLDSAEILKALNSSATISTETVTNAQLVSKKIVKKAEVKDGNLYITPLDNTGNLLFPESGEVSQYSEVSCYAVDLVVEQEGNATVYYLYDYYNRNNGGISRVITEEIKMYGTGQYKVSMDVKASNDAKANLKFFYDNFTQTSSVGGQVDVTTDWKNISLTLDVTEANIDSEVFMFIFTQLSAYDVDYIALKNITFTKVK